MGAAREKRKREIGQVFRQLLSQAPFEKISVEQICQAAKIHRSTFYRNFQDKYDLLDYVFNTFFIERLDGEDLVKTTIEIIYDEKEIFRNISLNNHRNNYAYWSLLDLVSSSLGQAALTGEFDELNEAQALLVKIRRSKNPALTTKMIASSLLTLMYEWIGTNYAMSPKEVATVIREFYQEN